MYLNSSSPDENRIGWEIASQFIESLPNARDPNTPVAIIHQGYEPSTFTGFFDEWDRKLWDVSFLSLYLFIH